MPVKLGPRQTGETEARIEIIPLIDIMFFLLASFMLVSLSMVHLTAVPVNLPTATTATTETQKDFLALTVDAAGQIFLDQKPVGAHELLATLKARRQAQPELRVLVSGDAAARHGDVLRVLDLARAAGIERVAFEVHPPAAAP
ncbi:MAG TPA: biopolymer transporter ExbD [Dongiaceae bacterium]|jgi:biopolymer transport protein ExbD|nr:biopolymer transporter ExbD [Dongiaceae bacterium]